MTNSGRYVGVSGICLAVIALACACAWFCFKSKHQHVQDSLRAEVQSLIAEAESLARNPATVIAAYANYEAAYIRSAQLEDRQIARNIPSEMAKLRAIAAHPPEDDRTAAGKAAEAPRIAATNDVLKPAVAEEQIRRQGGAAPGQKQEEVKPVVQPSAQAAAAVAEEHRKAQETAAEQSKEWTHRLSLARTCLAEGRRDEAAEHLRAISGSGDAQVLHDALKLVLGLRDREMAGALAASGAKVAPSDSLFSRAVAGCQKLAELGKAGTALRFNVLRLQDALRTEKAELEKLTASIQGRNYIEVTTTTTVCPTCNGTGKVTTSTGIPAIQKTCSACGGRKNIVKSTQVSKQRDVAQITADRDRRKTALPEKEKQLREAHDRAVNWKKDVDRAWSDMLADEPQ